MKKLLLLVMLSSSACAMRKPAAGPVAKPVSSVDQKKQTQLVDAARSGKLDEVSRLLRFRPLVDISAADVSGDTALQVAISGRNHDLAKLLLSKGANPNQKIFGGLSGSTSPLANAIGQSDSKMVELLIEFGADPYYEYVEKGKPNRTLTNYINYSHGDPVEVKKIEKILNRYLEKNKLL